jgi:hypothetical protein
MVVPLETYRIGSRIRIARGKLKGLTGVVAKMSEGNSKCVLTIDGWASGVCIAVSCDILRMTGNGRN